MSKTAHGKFQIKNSDKYIGKGTPTYRSSWEFALMNFLDNHPNVIQWASEAIHIPYTNPLTGRKTIYVPDFLIIYQDKNGSKHGEVLEVKPKKETSMQEARTQRDKAAVAVNMAKWQSAEAWCKSQGLKFRVVTEDMIFHQGSKRK